MNDSASFTIDLTRLSGVTLLHLLQDGITSPLLERELRAKAYDRLVLYRNDTLDIPSTIALREVDATLPETWGPNHQRIIPLESWFTAAAPAPAPEPIAVPPELQALVEFYQMTLGGLSLAPFFEAAEQVRQTVATPPEDLLQALETALAAVTLEGQSEATMLPVFIATARLTQSLTRDVAFHQIIWDRSRPEDENPVNLLELARRLTPRLYRDAIAGCDAIMLHIQGSLKNRYNSAKAALLQVLTTDAGTPSGTDEGQIRQQAELMAELNSIIREASSGRTTFTEIMD